MTVSPTTAASSAVTAAATAGTTLAGNFNTFLTLLTTQLKNQDPTSPLDTNQFTSQLVQFASVEQQINTNTNLNTLINLSQAGSLYQASAMVGHQIAVTSDKLALQGGNAALQYTLSTAQPVSINVSNSSGTSLYQTQAQGRTGTNPWTWNGITSDGQTAPDGAYTVTVKTADAAAIAVPFNVVGTATAVTMNGTTPTIALGPLSVPASAVQGIIQ